MMSRTIAVASLFTSLAFSRRVAISSSASAAIVFKTTFGPEIEADEPTMRNSNLLPVKANGEVRLRSVLSIGSAGSVSTPIVRNCCALACVLAGGDIFQDLRELRRP